MKGVGGFDDTMKGWRELKETECNQLRERRSCLGEG
jgi:hypothetical protein